MNEGTAGGHFGPMPTHADPTLAALDLCVWRAGRLVGGARALREAEDIAASAPDDAERAALRDAARLALEQARQDRRAALTRTLLPLLPAALVPALVSLLVGLGGPGLQREILRTSSPLPGPERRAVLSLGPLLGAAAPVASPDGPEDEPAPAPARPAPAPARPALAPPPRPSAVEERVPPAQPEQVGREGEAAGLGREDAAGEDGEAPEMAALDLALESAGGASGSAETARGARSRSEGPAGGGRVRAGQAGGEGFQALREVAPMAFLRLGEPAPGRRSARVGLFVAHTEVSQAQWVAVQGLDLGSTSGHWDHPAEAMSWCEALRYANALSRREGRRPAYRVDEDCERRGEVHWNEQSDGFRLLTEAEWEALAEGGQREGQAGAEAARINNRGLGRVGLGSDDQQHGLSGLRDNAREWVWGEGERRSVARGCGPGEVEPCRLVTGPAEVPLGVGLRLASGAP